MKCEAIDAISAAYGSPSMRREWIEMIASGASLIGMASPSMRREWIEMGSRSRLRTGDRVSLHAEGVD